MIEEIEEENEGGCCPQKCIRSLLADADRGEKSHDQEEREEDVNEEEYLGAVALTCGREWGGLGIHCREISQY